MVVLVTETCTGSATELIKHCSILFIVLSYIALHSVYVF
jgi:hypothetical protein